MLGCQKYFARNTTSSRNIHIVDDQKFVYEKELLENYSRRAVQLMATS